jgi:biopolymer transport protein ExbD
MAISIAQRPGRSIADINVTPMADIMIVLLIIFMLATPLISETGARLPVAANTADRAERTSQLVVVLRSDGSVSVGRKKFASAGEAASEIRSRAASLPADARLMYLKADRALPFSSIQRVTDWCREAGVEEVSLITDRRVRQ